MTSPAHHRCLAACLAALSAILLFATVASAADAPDLSAPKSAVITFERAAQNGDIATCKAASVADDANQRLVEMYGRLSAVSTKFRDALTAKFGAEAAKSLAGPDPKSVDVEQEMKQARVNEQGDTATVSTLKNGKPSTRVLRKTPDGQWRVDVVATLNREPQAAALMGNPALLDALIRTTQELTDELNQGRYKDIPEVRGAMMTKVRAMMAQQQLNAATAPASQPSK